MAFNHTVTRIERGITSSGRLPYVLAVLDCGHRASVELKPSLGTCTACGRTLESTRAHSMPKCECGAWSCVITYSPHSKLADADIVTKPGDVLDCETCAAEDRAEHWLRYTLDRSTVHHSRLRHGMYHFYRHDVKSPSGFFLIGSCPANARFDKVLAELGQSPLSPTEGA
jgi:hypothetical protein